MSQSDALLTVNIWKTLTSAAKKARKPVFAAVAYFGRGASRRLPLPASSRLVVDASEHAVKCGQTCPADLKRLQKRGVIIYSAENLHAKLYVFDRVALVGSANVSDRSAGTLIEAMIQTTRPSTVGAAKAFVRRLCLNELSPGALDRLGRMYRPPQMQGNIPTKRPRSLNQRSSQDLPRLFLMQMRLDEPPAESAGAQAEGLRTARSRRKHGRGYVVDYYWNWGDCKQRAGDKIVQVTEEGPGRRLVTAPADVIHKRIWRKRNRRITFVYLEHPDVRRTAFEKVAQRIGYGAKKKLARNGLIRDQAFSEKLLTVLNS